MESDEEYREELCNVINKIWDNNISERLSTFCFTLGEFVFTLTIVNSEMGKEFKDLLFDIIEEFYQYGEEQYHKKKE